VILDAAIKCMTQWSMKIRHDTSVRIYSRDELLPTLFEEATLLLHIRSHDM
jgi:hypothetical protein